MGHLLVELVVMALASLHHVVLKLQQVVVIILVTDGGLLGHFEFAGDEAFASFVAFAAAFAATANVLRGPFPKHGSLEWAPGRPYWSIQASTNSS